MGEGCSIQRGVDQGSGVGVVCARRRKESHSAPPALWSFRMNASEDHPPTSNGALHDRGGSVGIFADNRTPAGELRAILPIVVERWPSGNRDRHWRFADSASFGGVEAEPHASGQIQTVVARIPGEEATCTDSEVIQSVLYCV